MLCLNFNFNWRNFLNVKGIYNQIDIFSFCHFITAVFIIGVLLEYFYVVFYFYPITSGMSLDHVAGWEID